MSLWRFATVVVSVVLAIPLMAGEEERPQGLMWNKTGLPLVFPLQVKSAPGTDYFMVLRKVDDGEPALAAYVRGGEFFRVLVPPGTFDIDFAAGKSWQDEETLFGSDSTMAFALPGALTFAVLDDSTKGGHIIDLRDLASDGTPNITVASTKVCQGLRSRREVRTFNTKPRQRETDAVGQEILERRFLEGANVFQTYNRERQQDNLDPPVLGLPKVPLAVPREPKKRGTAREKLPAQRATRLYERPC